MKHPEERHVEARAHILVVEDDPAVRRSLERVLRSLGFAADFATTVQEGLSKLNGHRAALIDLHLPDGFGTTLLLEVRRRALPIRVAIWSGHADAQAIIKACGEVPDATFRKPIESEELCNWLTSIVN